LSDIKLYLSMAVRKRMILTTYSTLYGTF
jgi:hypothetical protein